jgi:hypothetical protein
VKRAVPVRRPEWPEGHFPTSKQLRTYLLFWEHQRKPLEPDPGAGLLQKSFWLDLEDLDVDTYHAECFRGARPDRALFIRRIIATYHRRSSAPLVSSTVVKAPRQIASPLSGMMCAPARQASQGLSTRRVSRELSPGEVNEISRARGLAICWQPGNVYCMGRTADGKSCLVQVDVHGRELAKYGSW